MQAVILAAGEGRRMLPLTASTPKPLLVVGGRPILEHLIDSLPLEVNEVILVIGYRGDLIRSHFGGGPRDGRMFTYVQQDSPKGTYDALLKVRPHIAGKFLVLMGDDLHDASVLADVITKDLALIASRHEDPSKFGVVVKNADGSLKEIHEKPPTWVENLVSTGAMVLDERIFGYDVSPAANGELYLPVALQQLAAKYPVQVVEESEWIPIGYPEDLATAAQILEARAAKPVEEPADA